MFLNFVKAYLIVFLLPACVYAQLNDDFETAPWKFLPNWHGDTTLWKISEGKLHTNASTAGSAYLSSVNDLVFNTEIEIKVNLKFNTSGSNYVDIILWQNHISPVLSDTSVYVRLGSSKDDLHIYFKQGSKVVSLFNGHDGLLNNADNTLKLKFQREAFNQTTIWLDSTIAGNQYCNYGSFLFPVLKRKGFFSLRPVFTAGKSFLNRHFFDDIYLGKLRKDTIPPVLLSISLIDSSSLGLTFTEPIGRAAISTSLFSVPDLSDLKFIKFDSLNPARLILQFGNVFHFNKDYMLTYSGVGDLHGNQVVPGVKKFVFKKVLKGAVIINELMSDPSPPISLPEQEYIELLNTTKDTLQLKNWYLYDGITKYTIPDVIFLPDSYLLLTSTTISKSFLAFGKTVEMAAFPSLNNDGDVIGLHDAGNDLIDAVAYTSEWYHSADKDDGGYSIERINPLRKCSDISNWTVSESVTGGTPCAVNSVLKVETDTAAPLLVSNLMQGDTCIISVFNEILSSGFYYVNTKIPLLAEGQKFETVLKNICDCEENCIDNLEIQWVKPQKAISGDILINEILFNPLTGGADFVELINTTDKYIDLNLFSLANTKDGNIYTQKKISLTHTFNPNEIVAFTEDSDLLFQYYPKAGKDHLYRLSGMPAYNDDMGEVVLIGENKDIIDRVGYDESWHNMLLKDREGVSLERISTSVPSDVKANWTSASFTCGFATPGLINSHVKENYSDCAVDVFPQVISPDNDGFDDFMQIRIKDVSGKMLKIDIIDLHGRLVKQIANNEIGGADNYWIWDGDDINGHKVYCGPYFLAGHILDENGSVSIFKKKIVVAWRKF